MDSATLLALQGRLQAALIAVEQLIAANGRRCADCNRHADDLALCADGKWRGPSCRKRHEAATGDGWLPIEGEGYRPVETVGALQEAELL